MTDAADQLASLWKAGTDFLGVPHAILGGAMSWVSERNLVAAISNAGGFGVIACGSMTPDLLAAEIEGARGLTDKPFGVNLITMHSDLDALIDVCGEAGVGHVVLAGGLPSGASIARVKDFGARVVCFAPAAALAKRLIRSGVDALIIEGAEAGEYRAGGDFRFGSGNSAGRRCPNFVAGGIGLTIVSQKWVPPACSSALASSAPTNHRP